MSSAVQDVKVKEEYLVAPDSTTVDRVSFNLAEDVLLHGEDGLFYFGTVVQVDESKEKALIQFGDDTSLWSDFRDLKKIKLQEENEISCILCKSIQSCATNQILLCHYCRRGYHQNCHQPPIPNQFANGETYWMCTKCIERKQTRERDKGLVLKTTNTSAVNNNNSRNLCKALPYNLENLRWDVEHLSNKEKKYCYCGENGEWNRHMFQCCKCIQWFHQECTSVLSHSILLGDRFYLFLCSICNEGKEERLVRLSEELTFADISHLILYNLTMETGKVYHDLDRNIMPFLEAKWKILQPSREILAMSADERRKKILSCFWKFKTRFVCSREMKKKKTTWALRVQAPPPFPTLLSKSLNILKLWTGSEKLRIVPQISNTLMPSPIKEEGDQIGRKRTRLSLPNPKEGSNEDSSRKLRVRQQRTRESSEESVPDSSDELRRKLEDTKRNKKLLACEDNNSSNSSNSTLGTPVETSGDETSSKGTLDSFIPPPKNFDGVNNPFATLSPRNEDRSRSSVFVVRPLKTRLSEKDIRITKNGEIKRKRLARKIKTLQTNRRDAGNTNSLQNPNASGSFFHTASSFSLISENQVGAFSLPRSDPMGSVLTYFGTEERISRGEKYLIRAKRVLPKGIVQYLIEWEVDRQIQT